MTDNRDLIKCYKTFLDYDVAGASSGGGDFICSLSSSDKLSKNILLIDTQGHDKKHGTEVYDVIKEANKSMEQKVSNDGKEVLKDVYTFIKTTLVDVLGVEIVVEKQIKDLTAELTELLKKAGIENPLEESAGNLTVELIEFLIEKRKTAKKDKNFALSDEIRDKMAEIGVKIKDGREKTTWTI